MKKETSLNILFISNLSSINFAWHFLNNAKVFSFDEITLEQEQKQLKIEKYQNNKHLKEINCVVCFKEISEKQCNEIISEISAKTQVITNNVSCYLMFKQRKVNVIFVKIKDDISLPAQKLNLICSEEIQQEIFQEWVTQKVDKKIISTELSNMIISACIGGVSCTSKNNVKSLVLNIPKQTQIIKLISESIRLTNSVMLTVANFEKFNFYKFLCGKGILKKIKQHFKLFALLYSLRKQTYAINEVTDNLNNLVALNYNGFCELKYLEQLLSKFEKCSNE